MRRPIENKLPGCSPGAQTAPPQAPGAPGSAGSRWRQVYRAPARTLWRAPLGPLRRSLRGERIVYQKRRGEPTACGRAFARMRGSLMLSPFTVPYRGDLRISRPRAIRMTASRLGVVELFDCPGVTLPWHYHPGFLRRCRRRRRACPWEKHARFANAIPEVVDTQEPGHHRSLGPSTRRGPERHPVGGTAETLRRATAASYTWPFAP
jgi:hypothetical protein